MGPLRTWCRDLWRPVRLRWRSPSTAGPATHTCQRNCADRGPPPATARAAALASRSRNRSASNREPARYSAIPSPWLIATAQHWWVPDWRWTALGAGCVERRSDRLTALVAARAGTRECHLHGKFSTTTDIRRIICNTYVVEPLGARYRRAMRQRARPRRIGGPL